MKPDFVICLFVSVILLFLFYSIDVDRLKVAPAVEKLRSKRLAWYGHFMRRDERHVTQRVLNVNVDGYKGREEVLNLALGLCRQEAADPRACIHMTPQKEQQIDRIVEKLSDFLNNLTIEHEHFDIRLIKLAIEQHSDDEIEKETMLQLSVNDCQLTLDETGREEARRSDFETDQATTGKKPEVMYLELAANGQKLVEALDKKAKRPRLVYVQKDNGQLDYLFYKKK